MVLKNLEDGLTLTEFNHLLKMNLKELKNLVRDTTTMDLIQISFLIMLFIKQETTLKIL